MSGQRILVVGATSAIAMATARLLAGQGAHLQLAARNPKRLETLAADLTVLGAAGVETLPFDATPATDYEQFAERAWGEAGIDLLLVAHGELPDQLEVQDDAAATRAVMETNAISVLALLAAFAGRFEARGGGAVAVIASVSGDRGRQSNYVYGAAKAAVAVYLQGLRNRLSSSGVQVLTIKPGFVDTPMTAHMRKGLFWAQPDTVARGILRALRSGRSEVYLPGYWRLIMWVIRLIPEPLFKRLSL
jgi:short-subunit dehydrogenase